ncbi:head-tail connector protein [Massilia sp. S19_KUP03_FR1]|uniref:head-tail connector protein n=1 Tax=Massilia sp. S19_KUP03_FR1 TaxID=3025503 RepID=UPI002FCD07EA
MPHKVITPPATMAVSLAAARTAARVNGTALDDEIKIAVGNATTEAEHYTGRAFINRTYQITLDRFCGDIEIPASPVVSIVNFVYTDGDGAPQELNPADFRFDTTREPGFIVPAFGKAWPATGGDIESVKVDVICGYGPDDTKVPDAVKAYVLARVREQYAPPGTPQSPWLLSGLQALKVY